MKTLKELVFSQNFTGKTDAEIIAEWYVENDMATAGIEIVSQIAKQRVESLETSTSWLVGDLTMYAGSEYLIKTFGIEDGCQLDTAIKQWIIAHRSGGDFETMYPKLFEWVKDFIPRQKQPLIFWRNFLDWLNERGIYFKDQKKGGVK